ncbi:MAG TPA: hypothetical protein D7H76_01090 [Candidatus Poseidoniales archaeon]|nr:MAG TPA: hypothetical protein D7H76_01090 [Candidatus Poseidoniales archaeon]HII52354.1 hypothetical protein [Candidatus Thalassarchaeaceae archaeon]|tara:strand:+ start:302 stop:955 length:654 start_codon:yes stop_codon:yes gene_type:complete
MGWIDEVYAITSSQVDEMAKTAVIIVAIVMYSGLVFRFYRLLARRTMISIDTTTDKEGFIGWLSRQNKRLIFIILYVVLTPTLIGFWALVLSAILVILNGGQQLSSVAELAVAVVGAIRITSYFSENLAQDLSKMLPFAVLGVFLADGSLDLSGLDLLREEGNDLVITFLTLVISLSILETILRIVSGLTERWARRHLPPEVEEAIARAQELAESLE